MTINLPVNPPNTFFIDKSGRVTREWYRYLSYLTSNSNQFVANTDANYLLTSPSSALVNSRVLVAGAGLDLTTIVGSATLSLENSGVVVGSYGSASRVPSVTVDQYGRVTAATDYALSTSNVAEGSNLYFTNTRARSALSGGTGIAYNSGTGVIAVSTKLALYDGGDTPSAFTLSIVDSPDAAAWRAAIGAGTSSTTGTVTSVNVSGGTTGLSFSGGPITTSGTITMAGTLAIANGGTGATTAANARTNLGLAIGSNVQAWDADLDALAVLTGTNTIYYRSAANTWTAVTIGASLSFSAGTLNAAQALGSGTYTPTLTNVANIDASTAYPCQYQRVGITVTVSGRIDIDPTTVGVATSIDLTLPVATANFTGDQNAGGTAACAGVQQSAAIFANVGAQTVRIGFIATDATNRSFRFEFMYQII